MSDNIQSQENSKQEYLTSEERHLFDPSLAKRFGVIGAVLLNHFIHWILINKRANRNFHDGRTWTYQTLESIALRFSYLSKKQVEREIKKIVDKGILIKGNYNKAKFDRTVWYAFNDEKVFRLYEEKAPRSPRSGNGVPKSGNGNHGIGTPIPDREPTDREPTLKENINIKEKTNQEKETPKSSRARKDLKLYRSTIYLTLEEYQTFEKEWGKSLLNEMLDTMDDYILSVDKKYKNHAAALRNWYRRLPSTKRSEGIKYTEGSFE